MYRYAIEELFKWKEKPNRKPMIIQGARHVGKTWLMKEFGKKAYTHTVYINFEDNVTMEDLFSYDLDTKRLITGMELYSGKKIDPDNTLLIFDELQEVLRALTSLKYFNENAPEYHIVCACSFMGIDLHQGTSFPVGKVNFMNLYPLTFKEFLMATGKERFVELLDQQNYQMIKSFKQTYIDTLKQYYYVGGMPEAVQYFATIMIIMKYEIFRKKFYSLMNRIFLNMHLMKLFLKSGCFGIVFHHSLLRKIRNLYMVLFVLARVLKNMKQLLCGYLIVD